MKRDSQSITLVLCFTTEPIMVENEAALKNYALICQQSPAVDLGATISFGTTMLNASVHSSRLYFDLVKITDLTPMIRILESPDILKVMHGADYDVVSLKRDYNCQIQALFDTAIAAQFLDYEKFGLAHLIERHFGLVLEKKYQKHDWSKRPLYQEHIDYARSDTHFLLSLQELLQRQLVARVFLELLLKNLNI